MTEVYKIIRYGIAPPIMNYLFQFCCNTNNIRTFQEIFTENRKTFKYGTETVTCGAPFLWPNLHTKYKNAKSLDEFKSEIKAWKCDFCQCRLSKKILAKLRFYLKESILDNQGRLDNKNLKIQK